MARGYVSRRESGRHGRKYKKNYAGRKRAKPPKTRTVYRRTGARSQAKQIHQLCRAVRDNTKMLNGPRRTQHLCTRFDHILYRPQPIGNTALMDYNGCFWPLHYKPWQKGPYPATPSVPYMKTEAVFDPNQTALQDSNRVYFHGFTLKGKITPYNEHSLVDCTLFLLQSKEDLINTTDSFTQEAPPQTPPTSSEWHRIPVLDRDVDYTANTDYSNMIINSGRWKVLRSQRVFTSGNSEHAGPEEFPRFATFNWYVPQRQMYTAPTDAGTDVQQTGLVFDIDWRLLPASHKYWILCMNNNDPINGSPYISFNCVWNMSCWGNVTGPVP